MAYLHHLSVGCGDASIFAASRTFLIDCNDIASHREKLPTSKHICAVFITHQHSDHYSGIDYLRKNGYHIDNLIYSPYDRRRGDSSVTLEEWQEFEDHKDYFRLNGTKLFNPFRQQSFEKPWWSISGLQFWVLGPEKSVATSDAREIHDACLVVKVHFGSRSCLFTGDASDESLAHVARIGHNCDDILHASHHGSINGADLSFIKSCNAKYTVISTKAGVYENVPHPKALRRYSEHTEKKVYRTDVSGSLSWSF